MMEAYSSFFQDVVRQYGYGGDASLEYIGLVFADGVLRSGKVYHVVKASADHTEGWVRRLWETYFQDIGCADDLKICDVSRSSTEPDAAYRMIAELRKPITMEQMAALRLGYVDGLTWRRFLDNAEMLHAALGKEESPLFQLGVETDADFRYAGFKYYLSVRTARDRKARVTRELAGLLQSVQSGSHEETEEIGQVLHRIQDCGYSPAFIGINDNGTEFEGKLYFVSDLLGRTLYQKAAGQIQAVCKALHLSSEWCDTLLKALEEQKLYPEGIAVSFGNDRLLRLYVKEISPNLLKYQQTAPSAG